jgi:hypothetical protein
VLDIPAVVKIVGILGLDRYRRNPLMVITVFGSMERLDYGIDGGTLS